MNKEKEIEMKKETAECADCGVVIEFANEEEFANLVITHLCLHPMYA